MSTDSKENPSYCEEGEHFFARLWSCISPALNTSVDTLCELIGFGEIEPRNIFNIEIGIRECVVRGVGDRFGRGAGRGSNRYGRGTGRHHTQWCTAWCSAFRLQKESKT